MFATPRPIWRYIQTPSRASIQTSHATTTTVCSLLTAAKTERSEWLDAKGGLRWLTKYTTSAFHLTRSSSKPAMLTQSLQSMLLPILINSGQMPHHYGLLMLAQSLFPSRNSCCRTSLMHRPSSVQALISDLRSSDVMHLLLRYKLRCRFSCEQRCPVRIWRLIGVHRYIPNRPAASGYQTNVSTYTLEYSRKDTQSFLDSIFKTQTLGYNAAGSGQADSQYGVCLACAIVERRRQKAGLARTQQCDTCMSRYCYDAGPSNRSSVAAFAEVSPSAVLHSRLLRCVRFRRTTVCTITMMKCIHKSRDWLRSLSLAASEVSV